MLRSSIISFKGLRASPNAIGTKLSMYKLVSINATIPISQGRSMATKADGEQTKKSKKSTLTKDLKDAKSTFKKLKEEHRKKQFALEEKVKERKLQEKIKERKLKDKVKERKLEEKEKKQKKKELAEITKNFRKLGAYPMFVKTKKGSKQSLADSAKEFNLLSTDEKEKYRQLADEYNEKMEKIYLPKPKSPGNKYSRYISEHYVKDDRPFAEVSKSLSESWKRLSKEEQESYSPSAEELSQYKADYEKWLQERKSNIESLKENPL
ncbi:uncharacterized protein RJT21DRAFT_118476 [Scheffersomyces amazonensis]|uniref:uncharacterized protein n=1 Tax=Scheffersomyces amazonensis TaxID=1078765 RepID=UPI00315D44F3